MADTVTVRQRVVTALDTLLKTILTTNSVNVTSFSVPLASMKLSAADGAAFIDCGALGASLLVSLGLLVTVTDSAGKKITGLAKAAGTGVMPSDLLNEDCSDISDWTDSDRGAGVSEADPAGQFRFDTNLGAANNDWAMRYRVLASPPGVFTIEIQTYFDSLGTFANVDRCALIYGTGTWQLQADFASDGLFIRKASGATTEVGTNIVKCNGTAAWQTWRFQVTKQAGEAAATVEVFLDDVSRGIFDCDYELASNNGRISFGSYGYATDNIVAHLNSVKVATGYLPAATGVTIVSAAGGSTYNWASKDAAFNYADPAGYTVTISIPYSCNLGSNVFWWRDTPVPEANLPALLCKDTVETTVRAAGQHEHALTIEAVISLRSSDNGETARLARADVEKALGTNVSPNTCLGGYAEDINPIESEVFEVEHEGIKGFGVALRFQVIYVTAPFDPYTKV